MADLAAPAFHERHRQVVGSGRARRRRAIGPVGQLAELVLDEGHGPLDFQPAHVGAGEDVAGCPGRNRHLGEAEDAGREILADVALHAAGPGRGADQSRAPRPSRGDTAPVSSNRAWTDVEFQSRLAAPATSRYAASRRSRHCSSRLSSRSKPTPPGRTRPRPKRLPHSRAVRLRKSPRIRPQYEAVGRKPTSPARAPRSPVWLASRSSSRAMPRSTSARDRAPDSRPGPPPPGSRPWRGRPRCRPPRSPSCGWCACSARRPGPARRRGAGSRARSPGERLARRGTGSGSGPAR